MSDSGAPRDALDALPPGNSRAAYEIALLLANHVTVDEGTVRKALGEAFGPIDIMLLGPHKVAVTYLEHEREIDGVRQPVVHFLSAIDLQKHAVSRETAVTQSWGWCDDTAPVDKSSQDLARSAVEQCRAALSFIDRMPGRDRQSTALLQAVLRALTAAFPVLAIHWVESEQIVDPQRFLVPDFPDSVHQGPVNVRMFQVSDGESPDTTTVMDTIGLQALGLVDLQATCNDLDPNEVGLHLFEVAHQLFRRGLFINDGDTIDGVGGRWRAHFGPSLLLPPRVVIEFDTTPMARLPAGAVVAVVCPSCAWSPPPHSRWECHCGFTWYTFDTQGVCPACNHRHVETTCLECGHSSTHEDWYQAPTSQLG
ncbi:MAG TPA: DUF4261 domain-containing protein [Labilithrix sp.]|jgi:hypothetical protein|nr:DUF4261 domain-containing protein [Labilithrix sp.]